MKIFKLDKSDFIIVADAGLMSKHGYNRLLVLSGADNVTVEISDKLIEEDKRWDGLKGYLTNTDIDAGLVVDQYHGLSSG